MDRIEQEYIDLFVAAINEIRRICLNKRIPMFISLYLPDKKKYLNDIISPAALGIKIEPDRITEHLNVANGFHTVLPLDVLHGGVESGKGGPTIDFTEVFDLSGLPDSSDNDP